MSGSVTVFAGPAGSGKTERLLAQYRQALRAGPIGGALWISPTHRAAAEIRGRLLSGDLEGCFAPGVMTFDRFAEQVVAASALEVRPISDLVKRQILRRLIRAATARGELKHYAAIADSAGLLDLFTEFVSELKRHEIWPDHFAAACGAQQKDRELLSIYRAYQDHLLRQRLYDAEGRFWSARELLHEGQTRPFERVRHVVIDGFTDFTRTQQEIIKELAARAEELYIALPLEGEGDDTRADLFAKPIRTLAQLRKKHPLRCESLRRTTSLAVPALAHIEQELFKSPRDVRPATETSGIEVVEAARAIDEMYLIGRRIKHLLVEGDPADGRPVRPGDVAVVVRTPAAVAALVREAFDDLGLPYALAERQTLSEAPAVAALVGLLRLHAEDWPFRGLLALLSNNYFAPDWSEWRAVADSGAADRAIRTLQIARHKSTLLAALDRASELAARRAGGSDLPPPDIGPNTDNRTSTAAAKTAQAATARAVAAFFARLSTAFDRLPAKATATEWAEALARLAAETGLTGAISRAPDATIVARDRAAWDLLMASLKTLERLSADPRGPEQLDARAMLELLVDVSHTESLPADGDEVGRVRVLSANHARSLSIPYVYFAGLTERSFPSAERPDRLYSEAEYERLVEAGLPLVLRAERSQEEMLLFYEVVTRARRRLCLSYPGLDDKGQPLLPSPFLSELEHVCGGRVERFRVEDLSPIPRQGPAAGIAEQRIAAVAAAVGLLPAHEEDRVPRAAADAAPARAAAAARSNGAKAKRRSPRSGAGVAAALLAGLGQAAATRGVFDNILAGLSATAGRAEREEFGPYEGMLVGDAARTLLGKRFGDAVRWSASRLEQYAGCPYQFFLSEVLRIEPEEELIVATDPLARGSAHHDLLAQLHRQLNAVLNRATSPAAAEARAEFERIAADLLAQLLPPADAQQPFQAALAEIDRRVIKQWLDAYLAQHEHYDTAWRDSSVALAPVHFEVSFGDAAATVDPLSTVDPLVVGDGARSIALRGRIDRIDLGSAGEAPVFSVVDYKTGKPNSDALKAIRAGDDLQVALYAIAAEWLLGRGGYRPWALGYWFVAGEWKAAKTFLQAHQCGDEQLIPTEEWVLVREQIVRKILALVDNIRAGRFPVASHDEHCTSYCDYRTVCRINQVRSLEKSWEPAASHD